MKQRHIVLNQNSHGVYFCICGATWKAQEKPSKPCPAADACKDPAQRA